MKRFTNDPFIFICFALLVYFGAQFASKFLLEEDPTPILQEAQKAYSLGEQTDRIEERKTAFNQSLKLFLDLDERYSPTFGNGRFYFDLGNNFFQLEEYPQALLYYYRAEQLRPRDEKVQTHLALTQKKLGITQALKPDAFDWLFFFHYRLSLPERLQLLFALTLLTFALISCYIWVRRRWIYVLTMIALIATVPLFLSAAYSYALSPIEGVMVQSSLLYRDAGLHYAKVKPDPLLAGGRVKVLDVTKAGKWLKIQTHDGTIGYVPQEALRII
ncbi:MAG: SH3 domain-containing protein [Parachlamydiaceae bacterium]